MGGFMTQVAAGLSIPVVALTLTPGTIRMPWINNVQAAMNLFLPGEHGGTAFAAAIFGDVNPSAKSPLHYPVDESSTIAPCWCGGGISDCRYTEGLFIAWHRGSPNDVLFPFGHGLSYTTFSYSDLVVVDGPEFQVAEACPDQDPERGAAIVCVWATVTNSGGVAGVEVSQMYMGFPESANEPERLLRGFNRLAELAPGASAVAKFPLYQRDVQIYSGDWQDVGGTFSVFVGTSSLDTPLSGSFTLQRSLRTVKKLASMRRSCIGYACSPKKTALFMKFSIGVVNL